MTVGERIRELRKDADLKQKEVADALHITNRMMSNYERDICNPSLEYLVALSRFFHVSTDYLLSTLLRPESGHAKKEPQK